MTDVTVARRWMHLVLAVLLVLLARLPAALAVASISLDNVLTVSWTTTATTITFTLQSTARGWAAVGVNTAGAMNGGDIYLGWFNGATPVVTDSKALGQSQPYTDVALGGTQDAVSVNGTLV